MPRELTPEAARKFYDGFGAKQDKQGFYEDAATTDLISHAGFQEAAEVFEFGCGTGRFAQTLFSGHFSPTTRYTGVDISSKMVELTKERLKPYAERATVELCEEKKPLPVANNTVDRFVSNYVFDLLSPEYARWVIEEARRVLVPGGKLCLVSLTYGDKPLSRGISWVWERIFRLRPQLVGGCHPVKLNQLLAPGQWVIQYRKVVTAFGIASEVVIAEKS